MNKMIVCINVVWASTLLPTPSSAQTLSNPSISYQALRDKAVAVTPIHPGRIQRSQPKANCPAEYSPLNSASSPTNPVTLPATHKKIASGSAVWKDLRSHYLSHPTSPSSLETTDRAQPSAQRSRQYQVVPTKQPAIVEAQGWIRDQQGQILLTSKVPTTQVYRTNPANVNCQKREG